MTDDTEITIPKMEMRIAKRVAKIANSSMRTVFLSDESEFRKRMESKGRSGPSLRRLRKEWNPLEPRIKPGHKIVMRIKQNDIWWLSFEEKREIQVIVIESAMQAIMEDAEYFVTAIMQDAISEDPELKYRG